MAYKTHCIEFLFKIKLVTPLHYCVYINSVKINGEVLQVATVYYTVAPGDTLWLIAQKFNTNINDIADYNGMIDMDNIYPGQRIKIWVEEQIMPRWYVVRSGDSLYSIAQRYNMLLEDILSKNYFENPNVIHPGQIIKLS